MTNAEFEGPNLYANVQCPSCRAVGEWTFMHGRKQLALDSDDVDNLTWYNYWVTITAEAHCTCDHIMLIALRRTKGKYE